MPRNETFAGRYIAPFALAMMALTASGCGENSNDPVPAPANEGASHTQGAQSVDDVTYYPNGTAEFSLRIPGGFTEKAAATCVGRLLLITMRTSYSNTLAPIADSVICADGRITQGEMTDLSI